MVFFLQQQNVPVWVAVLVAFSGLCTALGIGGIALWWLNRKKFMSEVKGQELKNKGEHLRNLEFENKSYAEIYAVVTDLRTKNLKLEDDNYRLNKEINIKNLQIATANGKVELALQERDGVADRLDKIENDLEFKERHCQEQIIALGLKYEAWKQWANKRIETLTILLEEKGITVPHDEYVEADELKGILQNGNA